MEINTINSFITYYERTREVTNRIIQVIPRDHLDWTYKSGKFTIGDIVRHIAAIERNLFMEVALQRPAAYKGCGKNLADGFDAIVAYV
ncbi:MAG: DinB family protein, partial [Bacteroidota bacterium]